MDLNLKNRTVLITGASQGLGFATALQLAREGARIIINSRSSEKLEAAKKTIGNELPDNEIICIEGDITNKDTVNRLFDTVGSTWGSLDILITNAGGPPPGPFETIDDQTWENAFHLSFLSQARLIRTFLPLLKNSSMASVLTITSISVKQPIPNMVLSNSIRAAMVGLTKSLSLEFGQQGIRFNSILPGWTNTDRVTHLMEDRAKRNDTSVEIEIQKQALDSALQRMAQPDEIAKAAAFLVSPAASYITGVMLNVDGGMYKGLL